MRNELRAAARNLPPQKTEYYEAAVNGAQVINYKQWKTFRGNQLILTHEERDLGGDGSFSVIDFFVYHSGKKIIHSASVGKRRIFIFYPDAGAKAMQSDSDGDGRYDRLTIMDDHDKELETFAITPNGQLTPNREAVLKEYEEALKNAEEQMKKLPK
ncbi:MAG: hypothetical protein V4689_11495 [Verrucomicrobiota bacterium]